MKYSLDEQFAPHFIEELKRLKIDYEVDETTDQNNCLITLTNNYCHLQKLTDFSELFLTSYQQQKSNSSNLQEYVQHYKSKIEKGSKVNTHLNKELLNLRFNELTEQIKVKKLELNSLLEQNKELCEVYEQKSAQQSEKYDLMIQNIRLKMEMYKKNIMNSEEQQLSRVENVLKNGMWGMRNTVENLIRKIQDLKNQSS